MTKARLALVKADFRIALCPAPAKDTASPIIYRFFTVANTLNLSQGVKVDI